LTDIAFLAIQGFAQLLVFPYWVGLQPVDGDQVIDDDWVKQEQTVVARGVSQIAPVEGHTQGREMGQ
jgi:hypothetical protein